MKKIIFLLGVFFCMSVICEGKINMERNIDGYFYINDNHKVAFFLEDDHRDNTTEVGIKAGVPFMIYVNKPISGHITWQVLSSVAGAYMISNIDNGHIIRFVTSDVTGTLVLLATDSNGNQLTITVYLSNGGLE